MRTHYDNLKIRKTASSEDIKSAYRKLAQKWHPDKFTDTKEKERAERYFRIIKQAYDVLSDPARKSDYDDYLADNPEPAPPASTSEQSTYHKPNHKDDKKAPPSYLSNDLFYVAAGIAAYVVLNAILFGIQFAAIPAVMMINGVDFQIALETVMGVSKVISAAGLLILAGVVYITVNRIRENYYRKIDRPKKEEIKYSEEDYWMSAIFFIVAAFYFLPKFFPNIDFSFLWWLVYAALVITPFVLAFFIYRKIQTRIKR